MRHLQVTLSELAISAPRHVVPLIAALAVLMFLGGCGKDGKPEGRPPAQVSVIKVEPRDIPVAVEYVAQTQSSQLVNIFARVNGFLDKRVYTEGSVVKEGDVLFLMDKKPFQVQVDGYAAALARQNAAFETARLNLERVKPLAEQKALSQKDLDDATGSYESAAAAVEQAKAQLESAKLNLSYCTITSPIAGITSAALQQDGTYIGLQNSHLTTVAVLSPIWVNFSISENEMLQLRQEVEKKRLIPPPRDNYEVEIILPDGSVHPHTGRITFMTPSYDAKTGTFLLRASIKNPDGSLRPNQYVRARVKGAIRPKAILVPLQAVQQGAKGHFVWVVSNEGKADYRPVVAAEWRGEEWVITEGLKAGEQVVVSGGITLQPGDPVQVKPKAGAPAEAAPAAAPAKKGN
jgi:membrane fusion protein, multidrug efflux system